MKCKRKYIGVSKYVIARTKEQTDIICKHLHSSGYRWNSGDSYLELDYWKEGADTDESKVMCYRLEGGSSVSFEEYNLGYIEFEEVFEDSSFIKF